MCGSNRRKRSSSTAGAGAAVNDDDLMTEILARLPTKSLFRFGCASKSWSGLISHVWSRRRERLLLPISGFCFNASGMMHYAPISAAAMEDDDDHDYCRKETAFDSLIISNLTCFSKAITSLTYSSCIGLLLFLSSSSNVHNPISMVVLSFSVFNPATSELVALPTTPKIRENPVTYLAFDPHKSPHYKVVCFNNFSVSSGVATVYSSMTGKWIQLAFRGNGARFPCHSVAALFVFHDDALHMMDRGKMYLSRFHLKIDDEGGGDFLKPITLPSINFLPFRQSPSMCIGKSTGRLCLAMNIAQESNLKIWMLESKAVDQYYWSLTHTLCTNVLYVNPQPARCIVNPVAFHPGSAAIIYVSVPGKLLECNLSSVNSKVIYRFTEDANAMITNDIFPVFPYLESIDPPGGKYIRVDRFLPSSTSGNNRTIPAHHRRRVEES